MRRLTSDRIRCLDCGEIGWVESRWLLSGRELRCPHCRSVAVERHNTRWAWLRDLIIITNAG